MSDYIYILESHLSAEQSHAVAQVQKAAADANMNVFLVGGAMRDMLGGFRIRDLDFSVEGHAIKLAKAVAEQTGARIVATDEHRRSADLVFPGGVTAQIAMSRVEKYSKTGARPQVSPATIQEDLRGRDFSVNAIALSLNRASRGLLLDPMNGLADLERRELRSLGTYTFFDDPTRLLRLLRFRVRLGFAVEARTAQQVLNARESGVLSYVTPRAFLDELKRVATEDSPAEIMKVFDEEGILAVLAPSISGSRLNKEGLERLESAIHMLPDDGGPRTERVGPFFQALLENLTSRDRQAFVKAAGLQKPETDAWLKLEARARKLEANLKSGRLKKPSHVYFALAKAPPDEVLLLLQRSTLKPVQERMKNYFQKYLPLAQEIGPEQLAALGGKPGSPKWEKAREALIATHLDRRPKKPSVPETAPEETVTAAGRSRDRLFGCGHGGRAQPRAAGGVGESAAARLSAAGLLQSPARSVSRSVTRSWNCRPSKGPSAVRRNGRRIRAGASASRRGHHRVLAVR